MACIPTNFVFSCIFTKILFMRFSLMPALLLFLNITLSAQTHVRYKTQVFDHAERTRNIYYGKAEPQVKRHVMDLYMPSGDTAGNRPVIVLMHGGGFKFGSKNNSRMRVWGRHFAKKGYVCVSINYRKRKGNPLRHFPDLALACVTAAEDAITATQYLKQHAVQLGIDTSKIILAGHSAGAMIALHAVYSTPNDIRHMLQNPESVADTVVTTSQRHNPASVAAIINFWGAIYDTTWLQHAKVPIVSVHGDRDRIVPFDFKDNNLFGSAAIQRNAVRYGIPAALKVYKGYGHELQRHFNPLYAGSRAKKRWRQNNAGGFDESDQPALQQRRSDYKILTMEKEFLEHQLNLNRRRFLSRLSMGLGSVALGSLMIPGLFNGKKDEEAVLTGLPHFAPKAKRI
ncbi:MAG: alpha/beta hydrolase, partial [Chitinophagaceae bacterium]